MSVKAMVLVTVGSGLVYEREPWWGMGDRGWGVRRYASYFQVVGLLIRRPKKIEGGMMGGVLWRCQSFV